MKLTELLWDVKGGYWYTPDGQNVSPEEILSMLQQRDKRIAELEAAITELRTGILRTYYDFQTAEISLKGLMDKMAGGDDV